MTKTIYGHKIGANIHELDAPQKVKLVPDNKTLIAMAFNDDYDEEVEPKNLKSTKAIFEHYSPSREVVFSNSEGDTEDVLLKFNQLKDFTKDGIIVQSDLLQDLEEKEEIYSRMTDVLKNNEKLQNVLSNEDQKQELVGLLETLIEELKQE